MKKILKSVLASSIAFLTVLSPLSSSVSAEFSESGNHWYYSDDQSFKYWGLTQAELTEYGIPVDPEVKSSIDFKGATPQSTYTPGVTSYNVTPYVNGFPVTFTARIAMRGDADSNGVMDLYDAIFVAGTMISVSTFESEFHEFTCDYNTDGEVNLYDVIEMCKTIIQTSVSDNLAEEKKRNEYVNEVVRLVNIERENAGLSTLTLNQQLCAAAQVRAKEIAQMDDLNNHLRPDGSDCFTVLNEMGIERICAGENLAAGCVSPAAVVSAWMDSPGHRENILDPEFNEIGIGYVEDSDTNWKTFWSQFFIGV